MLILQLLQKIKKHTIESKNNYVAKETENKFKISFLWGKPFDSDFLFSLPTSNAPLFFFFFFIPSPPFFNFPGVGIVIPPPYFSSSGNCNLGKINEQIHVTGSQLETWPSTRKMLVRVLWSFSTWETYQILPKNACDIFGK